MKLKHLIAATLACAASIAHAAPAPVSVFFDNDFLGPGQSNIQALIPLIRDPKLKLLGIGVVTGDAWLEEETQHTLRFLEIAGRSDIPVARGAEMPLIRTQAEMKTWEARFGVVPWKGAWNAPRPGRDYHPDAPGLVPPMPEGAPTTRATSEDAAHMLIRLVRAHPGEIMVVTAGPLTNIALALRLAPDLPKLAKEIVIEGGGIDLQRARVVGNADYATDFNFLFDPEAAHIVLTAPWQRITVLSNVTGSTKMTDALRTKIAASGTPVALYVGAYGKVGQPLWDELTTAVAIDRSLITKELIAKMDVDLAFGPAYGTAQIWKDDMAPHLGEQTVHIVEAVDIDRFVAGFAAQAAQ